MRSTSAMSKRRKVETNLKFLSNDTDDNTVFEHCWQALLRECIVTPSPLPFMSNSLTFFHSTLRNSRGNVLTPSVKAGQGQGGGISMGRQGARESRVSA
jgi:hypothetical protein